MPATNLRALEKAFTLGADVVLLDLEDSVPPSEKERARTNAIEAINAHRGSAGAVGVRVNGLTTPWCYTDIIQVAKAAGDALDMIVIPKVESASDVQFVGTLLDQIEQQEENTPLRVGLSALIETAKGLVEVDAISRVRPDRLEAMVFGAGDYAASVGARTTNIGSPNPDYAVLTDPDEESSERSRHWGDQWHFAISRIVAACRAEGLRPIDGAFGDLADAEGYLAAARRAAALGCEGKWAIHPSQVSLANEVFSPSEPEIARAQAILDTMKMAAEQGRGADSLDGRMIDSASVRMAENLMAKVEQLRSSG